MIFIIIIVILSLLSTETPVQLIDPVSFVSDGETNFYNFIPYGPNPNTRGASKYPVNRYPHAGRIGGGTGTGVTPPPDACLVSDNQTGTPDSTLLQFIDCIENVPDGGWIWIENNVVIDLTQYLTTNNRAIWIDGKNLTIASGRDSTNPGGLIMIQPGIFTNPGHAIRVSDADTVRFTGIRMYGPAKDSEVDRISGIYVYGKNPVVIVDNSDFRYWDGSGVWIGRGLGIVHHNHFFDNRFGWGYGVSVGGRGVESIAIIEANLFKNNKHSIAGTGWPGDKYTAGWNIVEMPDRPPGDPRRGDYFPGHDFDMHGGRDRYDRDDLLAGDFVNIYNNTFKNNYSLPRRGNIIIRGKTIYQSYITYNEFTYNNPEDAIRQFYKFGNLVIRDNIYAEQNSGWYVAFTSGGKANSWYRIATEKSHVSQISLQDIKGLGKDQIFIADGAGWKVVKFMATEKGGGVYTVDSDRINWEHLESNSTRLENIGFGDFNGDGYTDILVESDSNWHIRWSRTGEWSYNWNTGKPAVADLRFGDFNGDGTTDVFWVELREKDGIDMVYWNVSYGARSSWQVLNSWKLESEFGKIAQPDNLAYGNFIDNGKTDVFAAWNDRWWVNEGGVDDFETINSSDYGIGELIFADFNGDGITDAFASWDGYWRVSWGGRTPWKVFGRSDLKIKDLNFGDLDGNGETDVIGRLLLH